MITIVVMTATTIIGVDTTIANVALPHMQGSLGATQDQIAWVLTSQVSSLRPSPRAGYRVAGASQLAARGCSPLVLGGFTTPMLCGVATTLPGNGVVPALAGHLRAALVPIAQATLLDTWSCAAKSAAPRASSAWA